MGFIEWSSALSVGIAEIDAQHRVLIDLINRLEESRSAGLGRNELGGIVRELGAYAVTHFAYEERRFAEVKYPKAAAHRLEHEDFTRRVQDFEKAFSAGSAEIGSELLSFLKTWLTRHIAFSDRKYKPWLGEKT